MHFRFFVVILFLFVIVISNSTQLNAQAADTAQAQPLALRILSRSATVAFQTVCGFALGVGSTKILMAIHPVVGGVGWIMGSSLGVYAAGGDYTGRKSYWWTAASGATGMAIWLPELFASSGDGFGASIIVGLAFISSVVCELVGYYVFDSPQSSPPISLWIERNQKGGVSLDQVSISIRL